MPKTISLWIAWAFWTILYNEKFQFHSIKFKVNFIIIAFLSVIFSDDRKTQYIYIKVF